MRAVLVWRISGGMRQRVTTDGGGRRHAAQLRRQGEGTKQQKPGRRRFRVWQRNAVRGVGRELRGAKYTVPYSITTIPVQGCGGVMQANPPARVFVPVQYSVNCVAMPWPGATQAADWEARPRGMYSAGMDGAREERETAQEGYLSCPTHVSHVGSGRQLGRPARSKGRLDCQCLGTLPAWLPVPAAEGAPTIDAGWYSYSLSYSDTSTRTAY